MKNLIFEFQIFLKNIVLIVLSVELSLYTVHRFQLFSFISVRSVRLQILITIYTLSLTQKVVGKTKIEIFVTTIVVGTVVPTTIVGTVVKTKVV